MNFLRIPVTLPFPNESGTSPLLIPLGGKGGIRTPGTVSRTTV